MTVITRGVHFSCAYFTVPPIEAGRASGSIVLAPHAEAEGTAGPLGGIGVVYDL